MRVPPNRVCMMTMRAGSSRISPMICGFLAAFGAAQGFEGGVRRFGSDYGEELAFVGYVERVYAEDLTRPVHDVPDRDVLLPERDPVARVAGELVQDRPDTAARGVAHEAQAQVRRLP